MFLPLILELRSHFSHFVVPHSIPINTIYLITYSIFLTLHEIFN